MIGWGMINNSCIFSIMTLLRKSRKSNETRRSDAEELLSLHGYAYIL